MCGLSTRLNPANKLYTKLAAYYPTPFLDNCKKIIEDLKKRVITVSPLSISNI